MNKQTVTSFFKGVRSYASDHSAEILVFVGLSSMVTSTIFTATAMPKALKLLEEAEREKGEPLTPVEKVKTSWKPFIPAVATGVAGAACIIGANSVHVKRNAALATAYKLSETALIEYKDKVVETIGEKKVQTIKDKIAKDKVDKDPVSKTEVILTEKGNTLCYDAISGRYFKSDLDKIRRAENSLNKRMLSEMYISLNEFYSEIGLTGTSIGDELGWNLDKGLIELDFSSQIADDGTPCIVVDYLIAPRYDYSKLM